MKTSQVRSAAIAAALLVVTMSGVNGSANAAAFDAPAGQPEVVQAASDVSATSRALNTLRTAKASIVASATDEVAQQLLDAESLPSGLDLTSAEAGAMLRQGTASTVDNMIAQLEADLPVRPKGDPVGDVSEFAFDTGPDESGPEEDDTTLLGSCSHKRKIVYKGWSFLPAYTTIYYIGGFYNCSDDVRICGAGGMTTAVQKNFFSAGIGIDGAKGCPLLPILKAKGGTKPNVTGGAEIAVFYDGTFDLNFFVKVR